MKEKKKKNPRTRVPDKRRSDIGETTNSVNPSPITSNILPAFARCDEPTEKGREDDDDDSQNDKKTKIGDNLVYQPPKSQPTKKIEDDS